MNRFENVMSVVNTLDKHFALKECPVIGLLCTMSTYDEFKESKEFKEFKEFKESDEYNEFKEYKEYKEYKDFKESDSYKEFKEFKENKEFKEYKESYQHHEYNRSKRYEKHKEFVKKAIHEGCKNNYVVKLKCSGENGPVHHFNGFFYSDSEYVVTTGRIVEYEGASKYQAVLYKGTEEQSCDLELIKIFNPDVAVFRCLEAPPPNPMKPYGAQVYIGDLVHIVGFKGEDDLQPGISDGTVSYKDLRSMHVRDAEGYSGSPVMSAGGFVVGMVKWSEAKQAAVEVVCVPTINYFLRSIGLPGFRG